MRSVKKWELNWNTYYCNLDARILSPAWFIPPVPLHLQYHHHNHASPLPRLFLFPTVSPSISHFCERWAVKQSVSSPLTSAVSVESLRAVWRSQAALFALKFLCARTDSWRDGDSDMRALPLACQNALSLCKQSSGSRSPQPVAVHLCNKGNCHCLGETELNMLWMRALSYITYLDRTTCVKHLWIKKRKIAYWDERMMRFGEFLQRFLSHKASG